MVGRIGSCAFDMFIKIEPFGRTGLGYYRAWVGEELSVPGLGGRGTWAYRA
jgi:hypothetical protein